MCERFSLNATRDELVRHFGIDRPPAITARYNIEPFQLVEVIGTKADKVSRGLAIVKWGLVPFWSKDGKTSHIYAPAETVAGLPVFSDSFHKHRCIVPVSYFSVCPDLVEREVSHQFQLKGGSVMGFAGRGRDGKAGEAIDTCCIITTAANDLIKLSHERMPAILNPPIRGVSTRRPRRNWGSVEAVPIGVDGDAVNQRPRPVRRFGAGRTSCL